MDPLGGGRLSVIALHRSSTVAPQREEPGAAAPERCEDDAVSQLTRSTQHAVAAPLVAPPWPDPYVILHCHADSNDDHSPSMAGFVQRALSLNNAVPLGIYGPPEHSAFAALQLADAWLASDVEACTALLSMQTTVPDAHPFEASPAHRTSVLLLGRGVLSPAWIGAPRLLRLDPRRQRLEQLDAAIAELMCGSGVASGQVLLYWSPEQELHDELAACHSLPGAAGAVIESRATPPNESRSGARIREPEGIGIDTIVELLYRAHDTCRPGADCATVALRARGANEYELFMLGWRSELV